MGQAAARYSARCLAELVSAEQRLMWLAVIDSTRGISRHDLVQILRNATLALLPPQQHGIGEAVA